MNCIFNQRKLFLFKYRSCFVIRVLDASTKGINPVQPEQSAQAEMGRCLLLWVNSLHIIGPVYHRMHIIKPVYHKRTLFVMQILRYPDAEDRIFNRGTSDISSLLRETTLTGCPVESDIVRVVSLRSFKNGKHSEKERKCAFSFFLQRFQNCRPSPTIMSPFAMEKETVPSFLLLPYFKHSHVLFSVYLVCKRFSTIIYRFPFILFAKGSAQSCIVFRLSCLQKVRTGTGMSFFSGDGGGGG